MMSAGKGITNFIKKTPKRLNNYMNNDSELIFENYKSINNKEIILESTLNDFLYNDRPITTLSEAYAILDVYDIVEEAIPGLKAFGSAGMGLMKNLGQAGKQKVMDAGQQALQAGKEVLQTGKQAVQTGKQAVQAKVLQPVMQKVGDLKNAYDSAESAAAAEKVLAQANSAANELRQLLAAAVQQNAELFKGGALGKGGDPGNQRLNDVINHLTRVQDTLINQAGQAKQQAMSTGGGQPADPAAQPAAPAAPAAQPAAPAAAAPGQSNISPIFQR